MSDCQAPEVRVESSPVHGAPRIISAASNSLGNQLRRLIPTLLAVFVPSWIVLYAVLWACVRYNIPFGDFSRDSLAVARDAGDIRYYYGLLSNVGIMLWCSAAAISGFGAAILHAQSDHRAARFLFGLACLSLMLLLDDLFLLHERVFPEVFGVPEKAVLGAHFVVALFVFATCAPTIRETDFLLLGIACLFFAMSVAEDVFAVINPYLLFQGEPHVVEDGAKFLGIACWLGYIVLTALQRITWRLATEHSTQLAEIG